VGKELLLLFSELKVISVEKELLLLISEVKNNFSGKRTSVVVFRGESNLCGKRISAIVLSEKITSAVALRGEQLFQWEKNLCCC
jgi:hypothetical protein